MRKNKWTNILISFLTMGSTFLLINPIFANDYWALQYVSEPSPPGYDIFCAIVLLLIVGAVCCYCSNN